MKNLILLIAVMLVGACGNENKPVDQSPSKSILDNKPKTKGSGKDSGPPPPPPKNPFLQENNSTEKSESKSTEKPERKYNPKGNRRK